MVEHDSGHHARLRRRWLCGSLMVGFFLVSIAALSARVQRDAEAVQLIRTNVQQATSLQIPGDVEWFFPDTEGYLCDYTYARRPGDGALVIKILPRRTGQGTIRVYGRSHSPCSQSFRERYNADQQHHGALQTFCGTPRNSVLLVDNQWLAVAFNNVGTVDRLFLIIAEFGATKNILVSTAASFSLQQEILAVPYTLPTKTSCGYVTGYTEFPGITGTNQTLVAIGSEDNRPSVYNQGTI